MNTATYLINGKLLGTAAREPADERRIPRGGVSFFCPKCGDIWASVVMANSYGDTLPFEVFTRVCAKHSAEGFFYGPPGSIILDWDREYMQSLPSAVLQREVLLHCAHWEAFSGRP